MQLQAMCNENGSELSLVSQMGKKKIIIFCCCYAITYAALIPPTHPKWNKFRLTLSGWSQGILRNMEITI